jgi:hypothetical protein
MAMVAAGMAVSCDDGGLDPDAGRGCAERAIGVRTPPMN